MPVSRTVRRRAVAMMLMTVALFAAVVVRLVDVQVLAADRYAAIGENQRVRTVTLPADRGSIFDRNGRELAMSVRQTTIWANPRLITDPLATAVALAPVLGATELELREKLSRDAAFVYLARKVDDAVAEQVAALALGGVFTLPEPKRFAPSGPLAASVLGSVGLDNNGLAGLELQYEERLAGKPGRMVVERDPSGRDITGGIREHIDSARGDDLVLTIDRSLQYEAERALAAQIVSANAEGGIAAVMDTRTGEILALANMVRGAEGQPPQPAPSNTALTAVYEPGSVNKLINIAAALEEGLYRPQDVLTVAPTIRIHDKTFSEHDPRPTMQWSITDIMTNSSNVGSIMIGQHLGKDRLDRYLRDFGFGSKTGLGFPGESAGLLLDPEDWYKTSIGTVPIGQGIAVTAIQMLAAYNTVANGGEYVAPKLVQATVDPGGRQQLTPPSDRRRVLSASTATKVARMLDETVRTGTGTNAAIDGYSVAGKTGTARKPRTDARGYEEGAYVSSFAGFVPAERPALTAMVVLDEPTPIYGGIVAAPVFAEIAKYALRQFKVPPAGAPPDVPTAPPAGVASAP